MPWVDQLSQWRLRFLMIMSNSITLSLYIQPGASKTEVCGNHDGRVKIRLKAPPVESKANQALCVFLAEMPKWALI